MFHETRRIAALAVLGSLLLTVGCGEDEPDDRGTDTATVREAGDSGQKSPRPTGGQQSENRDSAGGDVPPAVRQRREELDIRRGADNSLQTFGAEPDQEEHAEVVTAMREFLRALARGDFVAACADFSESLRESNEDLVNRFRTRQGRPPVSGCSDLGADLRRLSEGSGLIGQSAQALDGEVVRVGIESDSGRTIVITRLESGELVHFPMVREDGRWKAYAIAPKPVRAG